MTTQTTNEACHDSSFIEMIGWFNRWLSEPITEREKVLLGEAVDYMATHRVRRYDITKFGGAVAEARNKEAENAGL